MRQAGKLGVTWLLALTIAAILPMWPRLAKADVTLSLEQQTEQAVARALKLDLADPATTVRVLRPPLPATARVHLLSVQTVPRQTTWMARLACDDSSKCLPFYAVFQATRLPSFPQANSRRPVPKAQLEKSILRVGSRVEVVEELSGMKLRTAGVCLQAGSVGDRIRVRNLTTHRVLIATVAQPDLVKVER